MPVNMIDPWLEIQDAMDLLSTRSRRSGLAFSRAAASVFSNDFPSLSRRKPRTSRLQTNAKSTDSDIADSKVADYEEMKRKLRNCQDEIYKLQAANSDLTQVNKRWHKYNSDMQIFIDRLQSTIRDQQEQINNIGEEQSYLHKREENNTECERPKCRKLREEVIKLREEVEHLQFQVRAHKDDWEAEKLEKQEALTEIDALQSRLNDVLRDICNLNRSQNEENIRRPQGCPCCKHWDRNNDYSVNSGGYHQALICSSSRQSPNHQGRYFFTDENIECDSSNVSAKLNCQNITEGEDRNGLRKLSTASDDRTQLEDTACSLRARDESYSTTTTLPSSSISHSRADSPLPQPARQQQQQQQQQQSTTLAMGIKTGNGATLTSYVRLPVVKSYSAPEGSLAAAGPSNVRLNSISLSVVPGNASNITATSAAATVLQSQPPRSLPSLINHQPADDEIACPHCREVFTSGRHLDFLDHFEQCKKE